MSESQSRQSEWEQRYLSGSTGWDRGGVSPALLHWLDSGQIPKGRVLVPGCGHGHEVAELIRRGMSVTAVDIAAQPVAHLREQMNRLGLSAQIIQADLLHWQPEQAFDAIYEQTCLCALDPEHWTNYEQELFSWLKPGGKLCALFMQTGRAGGPPFDCPVPSMQQLFVSERWIWEDTQALDVPHPNGLVEHGFVLTRR